MTKILIIGSNGFVGSHVKRALTSDYEVFGANKKPSKDSHEKFINLLDKKSIADVLWQVRPEIIINCAGIVENSELANQNPIFTLNLLKEIAASGLKVKKVIIAGSAAEYGIVNKKDIPVGEDVKLNANSWYGLSKVKETTLATEFAKKHDLPIIIARIFNPVGAGMNSKFLIPRILGQLGEIKSGKRNVLEVSRLDSKRDYINVKDVANAIKLLVDNSPKEMIYNIGSGRSTSNAELIKAILRSINLPIRPKIIETSDEKEQLVAIQANIERMQTEFGWQPVYTIEQTVKEIVNAKI